MAPEIGSAITQYFAQIWRIFEVQLPYLGLSIADLTLGCFIISLAIRIIKAFFGVESLSSARRGHQKRYERKERNAQNSHN